MAVAVVKASGDVMAGRLPVSRWVDTIVWGSTAAKNYVVPAGANLLVFSIVPGTGTYFTLRGDGTAAAAITADLADGTGSACNPSDRVPSPGETLSLYAVSGTALSIEVYAAKSWASGGSR